MQQLINGSDSAFTELERRSRCACVVFPRQPMPNGTQPRFARVGLETNSQDGSVRLLVDRFLTYSGGNPSMQSWFEAGALRFEDIPALRQWFLSELGPAYSVPLYKPSQTIAI